MAPLRDPAALLAPLRPGEELAAGTRLATVTHTVHPSELRGECLELRLDPPLRITIQPDDGGRAYARSARLCVRIHSDGVLTQAQQAAVERICARVQANDPPPPEATWTPERPPAEGTLWLVPGHLGNPLDLSIRAARILGDADRLFVEEGAQDAVAHIYRALMLGPPPPITELPAPADALEALLRQGAARRQTLVLFGADEGAPTLSDPGGQLLRVCAGLEAGPRVRSLSAGSSVSTAQMRAPAEGNGFRFWGILAHTNGHQPMIRGLRWGLTLTRTHIALATGAMLQRSWPQLRALRWRRGRLALLKELTRDAEQVWSSSLRTLPRRPPDGFGEDEILVVQIAFSRGS